MFSIVITEKSGAQRQLDFEGAEIVIGRLEDNDLCLPKSNVSKIHARLIYKDERYVLVDQKSTNGTYVNGRRISAPMVVRRGDKIYIGDFILTLAAAGSSESVPVREFSPLPPPPGKGEEQPVRVPHNAEQGRAQLERRTTTTARSQASAATTSRPPVPKPSSSPPPLPRQSPIPPPPPPVPRREEIGVTERDASTVTQPANVPNSTHAAPPARDAKRTKRNHHHVPTNPSMAPPPAAAAPSGDDAPDDAQVAALSGMTSPAVLAPAVRLQAALSLLMERLATFMNVARAEESAFPSEQQQTLERLLDQLGDDGALGPDIDRRFLREAAISEAVGLGPLDRLLGNRSVREIVVDGPTRVLADLGGGLTPVSSFFSDDSAVLVAARRLLHRAGQKLDPDQLVHQAQLPGGGAVQLLMPPLSPKGPLISVRCPVRAQPTAESLVTDGLMSNEMLIYLRSAVQQRRSVLVIGPAGAGVSSMLAVLARFPQEHERIVAIEHAPSASLLNMQILPLSRRAMPSAGLGELLHHAAQLRCDRLLVDDIRPHEALAALQAAASTSGVLFGMHAQGPELAVALLEQFAHAGLPAHARVRGPLLAAALQVVLHIAPDASGARKIRSISELRSSGADALELRTLFRHDGTAFVESFLAN